MSIKGVRELAGRDCAADCGAVVVALRERSREVLSPEVPEAQTPAEVRVKAVERNVETLDFGNAEAAKFLSRGPRRTSMEFGILSPETA